METNQNEELAAQVAALAEQVATLQARLAALEEKQEIPEADLVAIGAAVAAYFGHKAKIRAVRFGSQSRWAAATRERAHDRRVPHVR
ncbi:hypothetical protein [Tessaracoccus flavus]|uniref:Uncharacterized protein n=1 Tax=Tessaracoccus flavus TaxID=1610493 RepID=A0A1Q2CIJ1_9ACTN|nr:hypothetical protein [Tessaracoccus flavus]AQP45931.1 hypothetical protein RPIT_00060 [Tessaracoccus flavus]SDZ05238.1 hypothetical protein SAMN05428934_10933 [Tessaracoccus flavus]